LISKKKSLGALGAPFKTPVYFFNILSELIEGILDA
jgi:hypothetical protein